MSLLLQSGLEMGSAGDEGASDAGDGYRFHDTTHLRQILSFKKVTGEGVTMVGSEMLRILEETLPERFGGSPLDYQWLEEDELGFTRLYLVISPRVVIADEQVVIDAVLEQSRRSSQAGGYARMVWKDAGTFESGGPILYGRRRAS